MVQWEVLRSSEGEGGLEPEAEEVEGRTEVEEVEGGCLGWRVLLGGCFGGFWEGGEKEEGKARRGEERRGISQRTRCDETEKRKDRGVLLTEYAKQQH